MPDLSYFRSWKLLIIIMSMIYSSPFYLCHSSLPVVEMNAKAANLRRTVIPANAACRAVTRVIASGLCSGKKFDYKICSFRGFSTAREIWLDSGFDRLETINNRSCVSHIDAVCKRYSLSAKASRIYFAICIQLSILALCLN
jgi:hypothetical protein